MDLIERALSATIAPGGYVEMAMGCPRFPKIQAKTGSIPERPKWPSCRAIIAAEVSLFLTSFPIFFQGG